MTNLDFWEIASKDYLTFFRCKKFMSISSDRLEHFWNTLGRNLKRDKIQNQNDICFYFTIK